MSTDRYLPIDEEGYFVFDGRRVDDEELGRLLLNNIKPADANAYVTSMDGQEAWVEAFDAPLIARHVRFAPDGKSGEIDLAYHSQARFDFSTLSVDEWDRFHGFTQSGIPFVFSRGAQVEFFDLLDSFDDDSVTVKGTRFEVPPWLASFPEASTAKFWNDIYQSPEQPWELNGETPVLTYVLPQLKLSKARVLVLGSGAGHDAAYLARQGHAVTAVDMSSDAIQKAKQAYGAIENLKFVQADAFALPQEWNGKFDLVFEHTCYCAITPDRRNELVSAWRRMLHSQGHLLGVFFVMEKRGGPAFGGSEWEVRERLRKNFDFLFWTRWHASIERRKSKELVVYAKKKS
ncbi:MAG: methyltransferase domain-containing protein [Bdellovibrionales bacterium]|nr:methyltransferase domain-containing protein [Bdellovibrionales bacterium]